MADKVELERLFEEVKKLHADMETTFKDHGEWPTWSREFEEFRKRLLGYDGELKKWVDDASQALHTPPPTTDVPSDPKKVQTKGEKVEMAKQMADLTKLFVIADRATKDAINKDFLQPQDALMFLNEYLQRVMETLPEDNEYKKVLRHLTDRLTRGDEIGSLLDNAMKVKPGKVAAQTKDGVAAETGEITTLQALGAALIGAGIAGVTPALARKVGETDVVANMAASLQSYLSNLAGGNTETEEVTEEEEIEIEEDIEEEVAVKNEVNISI